MDNYYKENCAGLARRVEIFRGEFVKKRGIPAIAHASVSPVLSFPIDSHVKISKRHKIFIYL